MELPQENNFVVAKVCQTVDVELYACVFFLHIFSSLGYLEGPHHRLHVVRVDCHWCIAESAFYSWMSVRARSGSSLSRSKSLGGIKWRVGEYADSDAVPFRAESNGVLLINIDQLVVLYVLVSTENRNLVLVQNLSFKMIETWCIRQIGTLSRSIWIWIQTWARVAHGV